MSDPSNFTVLELREALRKRKLPMTGAKAELIARLMEDDPEGAWMSEVRASKAAAVASTVRTRTNQQ